MNNLKKFKKTKLKEAIIKEVIENEDYIRIRTETADKLDLPHSVVEKVLNDFLLQLPKFIFPYRNVKRISLFGFININIRKFLKKNNNN